MTESYKLPGWEARLVTWLLSRRLLVFWVVIALQLLLLGGLGALLWFTRVQDTLPVEVTAQGAYHVIAQHGPSADADALSLGQPIAAGQFTPLSGIVWGQAFELPLALQDDGLPYLAVLDNATLTLSAYVDPQNMASIQTGATVRIAFPGLEGAQVIGSVLAVDGNQVQIQVHDVETDEQQAIWQQLGWLVSSHSSYPASLSIRTRRLLSLLLAQQR